MIVPLPHDPAVRLGEQTKLRHDLFRRLRLPHILRHEIFRLKTLRSTRAEWGAISDRRRNNPHSQISPRFALRVDDFSGHQLDKVRAVNHRL